MSSERRRRVLVCGGGGFIGGHLIAALLQNGHDVVAADIKPLAAWYQRHTGADNRSLDLQSRGACLEVMAGCQDVYNLACDMGGIGFLSAHHARCMLNVLINTHLLMAAQQHGVKRYFFASSACVYPLFLQDSTGVVALKETDVTPAAPEGGYGWEKLFSERLCLQYQADFGLSVRVFRFHAVYGAWGTWQGGREKAPAAICRKVAEAQHSGSGEIELWGDGEQRRSFMHVDDCITGIEKLMASRHDQPLNLGRSELVSINQLVDVVQRVAGVELRRRYRLDAPQGVRGRNSDNTAIQAALGWQPSIDLQAGIAKTYGWIKEQVERRARGEPVVV